MKLLEFANLISSKPLPNVKAEDNTIQLVLNIVFVIVGALAFLMLVIAGFRYVIYGSDPTKLSEVKRQILHALFGLIVVALAATIVNIVMSRIG